MGSPHSAEPGDLADRALDLDRDRGVDLRADQRRDDDRHEQQPADVLGGDLTGLRADARHDGEPARGARDATRGGGPNLGRARGPGSAWDRARVDFASPVSGGDPLDETLDSGAASIPALFADRYRVLRPLGRGAAKEVYLVHDERLDRDVALALLTGGAAEARVRREMQVTGRLGEHPHVVTVHDAGEHDGVPYLILRALEGGSLAARVAAAPGRRLPVEDVARLGAEIADGLDHAHAHGVVHRDVKPANVWLDGAGSAVLGDFGVALDRDAAARLTADRAVVGTLAYLSPEQARGERGDARQRPLRARRHALRARLRPAAVQRRERGGADRPAPARRARRRRRRTSPPRRRSTGCCCGCSPRTRQSARPAARRPRRAARRRRGAPGAAPRGLVGREPAMRALLAACDEALAGALRVVALAGRGGDRQDALRGGAGRAGARPRLPRGLGRVRGGRGRARVLAVAPRAARSWASATLLSAAAAGAEDDADEARFALWDGVASGSGRAGGAAAARRSCSRTSTGPIPSSLGLLGHLVRALRGARAARAAHAPAAARRRARPRSPGRASLQRASSSTGSTRATCAELAEAVGGAAVTAAVARVAARAHARQPALRRRARARAGRRRRRSRAACATIIAGRRDGAAGAHPRGARARRRRRHRLLARRVVARWRGAGAGPALLGVLEPALQDGLLAPADGAGYRFAHAVTREVLYEAQPPALRARSATQRLADVARGAARARARPAASPRSPTTP